MHSLHLQITVLSLYNIMTMVFQLLTRRSRAWNGLPEDFSMILAPGEPQLEKC
jgi:hypothetical protein